MNRRARSTVVLVNIAAVAALFATVSAFAQTPIPWPPFPTTPSAPTTLRPNSTAQGPVAALTWRQGGFFATQPQPPVAQHFHVCIYDPAVPGQTCSNPTVQWSYAAAAAEIHRTPVTTPFGQQANGVSAYRLDLPAGTVPLDHPFLWRVGACRSQATSSCNYSAPNVLSQSTKNLKALNIAEQLLTTGIFADAEVKNTGTTNSGRFPTLLTLRRAVLDPSGVCATSLASDEVEPDDLVTTATGQLVPVQAGNVPGGVGIYRDGPFSIIAQVTADASLAAGTSGTTVSLEQSLMNADLPIAFLLIMEVNAGAAATVSEYDTSDNVRAECHVIFP